MTKQFSRLVRNSGAMLLAASAALACNVAAQAQPGAASAYVTDTQGSAIRTANYLCWHTGFWTPAAAIADCDPDLVARPAPVVKVAPPAAKKANASRAKKGQGEAEPEGTGR